MSTQIFKNYFKQNEKMVEIVEQEEEQSETLAAMVTKAVNDIISSLDDEDPAKNRETGLKLMAAIHKELQNPERLAAMVDDVADEIGTRITESKEIKVKIS